VPGSEESESLDLLTTLVEAYERDDHATALPHTGLVGEQI